MTFYRFIFQGDINLGKEEEGGLRDPTISPHELNVIYSHSVDLGLTVRSFRGEVGKIFPHFDYLKMRVTKILSKT